MEEGSSSTHKTLFSFLIDLHTCIVELLCKRNIMLAFIVHERLSFMVTKPLAQEKSHE